MLKHILEFKALKLRKIDDVYYTGTVYCEMDGGDNEIILAHSCRQVNNICCNDFKSTASKIAASGRYCKRYVI